MKKLLAFVVCVAMLAMTGVIFASADLTPVGDILIEWDPEVADKIELDGDINDWQDAGYTVNKITAENMWCWVGTMEETFEINAYFVSDSEFLYIAFWIVDNDFVASVDSGDYHDGDAFQIAIDFNREMQKILEEDPEMLENAKNIFYSFDCITEGEFIFYRNEKLVDQPTEVISESNGDGVKGAGAATEGGWCAEFALSWEMLYDDFAYKSYSDDYVAVLDKAHDLQLGVSLCYIDMSDTNVMAGAFGTFNNESPAWIPADNGMSLSLKWAEGVTIDCDGVLTPEEGQEYVTDMEDEETEPEDTSAAEETSAPAEETSAPAEETSAPAEETTAPAEETTAAAEESSSEAKTEAPAKEGGCGSVVATGAVVAVLAAAAAAVALKKKD